MTRRATFLRHARARPAHPCRAATIEIGAAVRACTDAAWIAGSSPAMTLKQSRIKTARAYCEKQRCDHEANASPPLLFSGRGAARSHFPF
jgi:hypothetical protein